ncbi:MAG TPA: DUF1552 domain-containing protein [Polyangia bacterium]|jgi:hypothetical protein
MKLRDSFQYIPRRTLLAGMGTAAAGVMLRPLFAAAAGASPTRLLVVHRPCGTFLDAFFPAGGDQTTFTLPSILVPFTAVKDNMVIVDGVTCPRDPNWPGDKHGAGIMSMMSGLRPVEIPGTDSGGDPNAKNQCAAGPSFDQLMLQKSAALQGTSTASIQATAYRPSSVGLPNFKVLSYTGQNGPLFPESRPATLFDGLFAAAMPNLSPERAAQLRTRQTGILDFVNQDLTRLRGTVPKSQLPKLDAHLAGIQSLQARLSAPTPGTGTMPACQPPVQGALSDPTGDVTIDEAQHEVVSRNQMAIILSAFQCDLTRVATFSFAAGASALRFSKIMPNFTNPAGHHDLSHQPDQHAQHAQVDTFYSQMLAEMIQNMKNTPDGDGTLLDHTLVVYFNECAIGANHTIENMPILMFGGKNLNLQTGHHLNFGGKFMTDVWTAIGNALGVPMTTFGDPAYNKGTVAGLFA